jgi:hypothetical protein
VGDFQSRIGYRKRMRELVRQLLALLHDRRASKRWRAKGRNQTMVAKKTGKPIQKGKKLKAGTLARSPKALRGVTLMRAGKTLRGTNLLRTPSLTRPIS